MNLGLVRVWMRYAVKKQKERLYQLFEMLPIIHELQEVAWSKKWDKALLVPLIVTWKDHEIIDINNTPIVSSKSLSIFPRFFIGLSPVAMNSFLLGKFKEISVA